MIEKDSVEEILRELEQLHGLRKTIEEQEEQLLVRLRNISLCADCINKSKTPIHPESGPQFQKGQHVWIKNKITHVPKSKGSPHGRDRIATVTSVEGDRINIITSKGTSTWRLRHKLRPLTKDDLSIKES